MKLHHKIFEIILLLEALVTLIIYFFFSAWDGGYCNQPSILNPFAQNLDDASPCTMIALHFDRGGVLFYVSLDVLLLSLGVFFLMKLIRRCKNNV